MSTNPLSDFDPIAMCKGCVNIAIAAVVLALGVGVLVTWLVMR